MGKVLLMQGNSAVVEGAISAGVRFYGGYPITPSTEIAEGMAKRLPEVGGKFMQTEDELAGMGAVVGASIAGAKAMTATSGPGFSLKQEMLGLACSAEIPCVVVDVQRVGPATGQPTSPSQGDVMQTRWGTHGDHWVIVVSPSSVPECFDLTRRAVELSETYRCPVILLMDEIVGHMRERIELPESYDSLPKFPRKVPTCAPEDYLAYRDVDGTKVPPMAPFGSGYRWHVSGLVHDETGFPKGTPSATRTSQDRLRTKLTDHLDDIIMTEGYHMEDAEYAVISYGGAARTAYDAVDMAREQGIKVGLFRPVTIWPFAEKEIAELSGKVRGILVHELNCGQYFLEVERAAHGKIPVTLYAKYDNESASPEEMLEEIKKLTGGAQA